MGSNPTSAFSTTPASPGGRRSFSVTVPDLWSDPPIIWNLNVKNPGMSGAIALVGTGLITIGLGNFISKATAGQVVQNASSNIVGVVLDPSSGTGRMKSRLLAIQADGKILVLDTTLAQTKWVPFQFSP